MVRVAGLKAHQALGVEERSADGMTTAQQLARDRSGGRRLVDSQAEVSRAFATRLRPST
jgi:polyphosphate kinase